jgi:hypothetical protein
MYIAILPNTVLGLCAPPTRRSLVHPTGAALTESTLHDRMTLRDNKLTRLPTTGLQVVKLASSGKMCNRGRQPSFFVGANPPSLAGYVRQRLCRRTRTDAILSDGVG